MIYGRKRGVWLIQIEIGRTPDGTRKRLTRQVRGSKKEAEAEEARLKQEIATGVFVAPSKETLQTFAERWLAGIKSRTAPATHLSYRRIMELRWLPKLGGLKLQQITAAHIGTAESDWLERGRIGRERGTGKGLSRKTVLNFHRVLHEAFEAAKKERLIALNPCDLTEPPKYTRREMPSLSADEAIRLLAALHDAEHGCALHTLLGTALRAGEVLGLRWSDVDLDKGVVHVRQQWDRVAKCYRETKTHRSRRPVPIDAELVAELRRQQVRQKELRLKAGASWRDTGLVFTDRLGQGLHHDQLSYALEQALKAAGLGHMGPHALRHTHASLLLEAGTHIKVVQERLGHASFAITADTYSHVAPGLGVQAAEDFRRVLRKESG